MEGGAVPSVGSFFTGLRFDAGLTPDLRNPRCGSRACEAAGLGRFGGEVLCGRARGSPSTVVCVCVGGAESKAWTEVA